MKTRNAGKFGSFNSPIHEPLSCCENGLMPVWAEAVEVIIVKVRPARARPNFTCRNRMCVSLRFEVMGLIAPPHTQVKKLNRLGLTKDCFSLLAHLACSVKLLRFGIRLF